MPGYPYQSSALSFFHGGRTQTHPTQAKSSRVSAAATLPGSAYLQETLLQQAGPQAPPQPHRASPAPLPPDTKPATEAPPHPKYWSLHPPDEPQMQSSLVRTSKLLERRPEPHPALAVLLRGECGGVWWHFVHLPGVSHFEPSESTTCKQDSSKPPAPHTGGGAIQGVWESKCSQKMKLQSCKEQRDGFNPPGSFSPAWSHLTWVSRKSERLIWGDFQQAA